MKKIKVSLSRAHILYERSRNASVAKIHEIRDLNGVKVDQTRCRGAFHSLMKERKSISIEYDRAVKDALGHIDIVNQLFKLCTDIRLKINEANHESGISKLMTLARGLTESFTITNAIQADPKRTFDDIMGQFENHIEYVRDLQTEKISSELDCFSKVISVFSDDAFADVLSEMDPVKRQRDINRIQDQIRDLNGSTFVEIEVPDELVDILGV